MSSYYNFGEIELIPKEEDPSSIDELGFDRYPFKIPKVILEGFLEDYYPQVDFSNDDDSVIVYREDFIYKYTISHYTEVEICSQDGKKCWIDGRKAPYTGEDGFLIGDEYKKSRYTGQKRSKEEFSIVCYDTLKKKKTEYKCEKNSITDMDLHEIEKYCGLSNNSSPEDKRMQAIKIVCDNPINFKKISSEYSNDVDFILDLIKKNHLLDFFKYSNDLIKNNLTIIEAALKKNGNALKYFPDFVKKDKHFILMAVKSMCEPKMLKDVNPKLFDDLEFVRTLILINAESFQYLPDSIRNNREIAMKAIIMNYFMFRYIGKSLRGDKMFVTQALKYNDGSFYRELSNDLKNDRNILMLCIKQGFFNIPENFYNDRELIIEAFKYHCFTHPSRSDIELIAKNFKDDKEIIRLLVSQNMKEIRFCDNKVVLPLVKENPSIFLPS